MCACVLDCDMKWICGCSSRAIECEDLCFKRWEDIEEVFREKEEITEYVGCWGSLQEEVALVLGVKR